MLQYIGPATGLLFTLENILWINIGVFVGSVFAAIPGLSVILCVILFLPVTYTMTAIPGMMFLLGIYCAGGYGGSVSAILINTPGTPHAAATMLDGHPLSEQGRTKAALKIALYASTFGGVFSALMLLFLGPRWPRWPPSWAPPSTSWSASSASPYRRAGGHHPGHRRLRGLLVQLQHRQEHVQAP